MPLVPKLSGANIGLVAVFTALIALSTWPPEISLAAGVPISLQTLGVVLAGLVLGAWRGFAATLLYLLAGIANLPVFADGAAGWPTFVGATGGYLWAFPIAAFLVGWLAERVRAKADGVVRVSALVGVGLVSMPVIYAVGVTWLAHFYGVPVLNPAEDGGPTALAWGLIPFVIGDLIKVAAAAFIAQFVHRAYPQLLAANGPHFVSATSPEPTAPAPRTAAKKSPAQKA